MWINKKEEATSYCLLCEVYLAQHQQSPMELMVNFEQDILLLRLKRRKRTPQVNPNELPHPTCRCRNCRLGFWHPWECQQLFCFKYSIIFWSKLNLISFNKFLSCFFIFKSNLNGMAQVSRGFNFYCEPCEVTCAKSVLRVIPTISEIKDWVRKKSIFLFHLIYLIYLFLKYYF